MSSNANRRRNADSFRMVEEAMKQAGIGKDEPVALVGHSQGGIVAAALASDLKDSYAIDHVVTAGSPVANHPIPPKTWVTSIEIEDELVASLDGGRNPSTEQWLTVRGKVTQTTGVTPPTVNADRVVHARPEHRFGRVELRRSTGSRRAEDQGDIPLAQIPSGRVPQRHRSRLARRGRARTAFPADHRRRTHRHPILRGAHVA